ncbi:MAG: response regulator [Thermoproteota archaeon]|nr:response regulator [Thermoproteota archaeon]
MQTEQKVYEKKRKSDIKLLMIVDDDLDILTIMKKSLKSDAKINVYGFTSPVAAVQEFAINPQDYDAVISDIRMPAMNGFELARKILQINPSIKVFLTTAFEVNMKEFSVVFPSLKVSGIISKPFRPSELKNLILKHLQKTQA